jgi:hypothetical protein
LIIGAAIILIANAFALVHAAINRFGPPDSVITLTKLELNYRYRAPSDDDSGVALYLNWADPFSYSVHSWLNEKKLEELGFDVTTKDEGQRSPAFYRRPRPAFVAFEYSGPAWRAFLEESEKNRAASMAVGHEMVFPQADSSTSHLMAVDADRDASALRKRHPDGKMTLIVPALISAYPRGRKAIRFDTSIRLLSSSIHVPRPFSDQFRSVKQPLASFGSHSDGISAEQPMPLYKVTLHFGTFHEPWVTAVEIPPATFFPATAHTFPAILSLSVPARASRPRPPIN